MTQDRYCAWKVSISGCRTHINLVPRVSHTPALHERYETLGTRWMDVHIQEPQFFFNNHKLIVKQDNVLAEDAAQHFSRNNSDFVSCIIE